MPALLPIAALLPRAAFALAGLRLRSDAARALLTVALLLTLALSLAVVLSVRCASINP
jgi:hypothetical protein